MTPPGRAGRDFAVDTGKQGAGGRTPGPWRAARAGTVQSWPAGRLAALRPGGDPVATGVRGWFRGRDLRAGGCGEPAAVPLLAQLPREHRAPVSQKPAPQQPVACAACASPLAPQSARSPGVGPAPQALALLTRSHAGAPVGGGRVGAGVGVGGGGSTSSGNWGLSLLEGEDSPLKEKQAPGCARFGE